MRTIAIALATLLLALATPSWATCTSPAVGTMDDIVKQATWTVDVLSGWRRPAAVRIALPALAEAPWSCLTWDVAIVLPPSATIANDAEGNATPTSYADLAAGATATFSVQMGRAAHSEGQGDERGWLRVKVRNPNDSPGVYQATPAGSPIWLLPVTFDVGWY